MSEDPSQTPPPKQFPNGEAQQTPATAAGQAADTSQPKLSGAELKKRAKAEKAARRAKQKEATVGGPAVTPAAVEAIARQGSAESAAPRRKSVAQEPKPKPSQRQQQDGKGQQTKSSNSHGQEKQLPTRRRPSHSAPVEVTQTSKQVPIFAHLYGQPRRHTIEGVSKDVHPAILALGLQLSSYTICGSSARCVATLLALKAVIQTYTTPPGHALSRHLTSHHLSPQLAHLKSSRPFAVSQSNAIRWLKDLIIKIDPSVPEDVAKANLATAIDTFIRERLTMATRVIADTAAASYITASATVLVYAHSAAVVTSLLTAHARGTSFRVVVADSRPLFEGRRTAAALAAVGIPVHYCLLTGLSHATQSATICILGAHALLANGHVYSRSGTALVAMAARAQGIPVVVCAESIKATERTALDGIVGNELGDEEELVGTEGAGDASAGAGASPLTGWRDKDNLTLLNALFDVTPAAMVDVVVTELGCLPPGSAAVLQRMVAPV